MPMQIERNLHSAVLFFPSEEFNNYLSTFYLYKLVRWYICDITVFICTLHTLLDLPVDMLTTESCPCPLPHTAMLLLTGWKRQQFNRHSTIPKSVLKTKKSSSGIDNWQTFKAIGGGSKRENLLVYNP